MTEISIVLSKFNSNGLCAYIENEEAESLDIHTDPYSEDAEEVCAMAAKKLRLLADAFDLLSKMENPCKSSTHEAAMDAAFDGN